MPVWSVLLRVVLCLALLFNSAVPAFAHAGAMACHSASPGEAPGPDAALRPEAMSSMMGALPHAVMPHAGMRHTTGNAKDADGGHHRVVTPWPMRHPAVLPVADPSQDRHAVGIHDPHGLRQSHAADCCADNGDDRHHNEHRNPYGEHQAPSPHDCDGSGCGVDCAAHCAAAMPLVTAVPAPALPAAQPQPLRVTAHRAPPLHHLIRPPIA